MPIQRGTVTFSRFQYFGDLPKAPHKWMRTALRGAAFEPIDPRSDAEIAAGFVEFEDAGQTEFEVGAVWYGHYALFAYRVDKLKVPESAIRKHIEGWTAMFQDKQGRLPSKREKNEEKQRVRSQLRQSAEPTRKTFDVAFDTERSEVFVWASSPALVDEIVAALSKGLKGELAAKVPGIDLGADVLDRLTPTAALMGPELSQSMNKRFEVVQ